MNDSVEKNTNKELSLLDLHMNTNENKEIQKKMKMENKMMKKKIKKNKIKS